MNGKELKSHFNLGMFPKVYIQRILSSTVPMYIITFNSRYKTQHIPRKLLQFNKSSMVYRFKADQAKFIRLSPPVMIEEFKNSLGPNAFIFIRDLGGERYLVDRDISPLNFNDSVFNSEY